MDRERVRSLIQKIGILPAIRVPSADDALFAASAVFHGGIPVIELTMTVPGALSVLAELMRRHSGLVIGAGTVLDAETCRKCIDAGAAFITSPGLDPKIVELVLEHRVLSIPGALTPTEVNNARKAGADLVKIFPCAHVGGPSYIRALKAPFPQVSMIASGGVSQLTARDFIASGATALGIREDMIPQAAVANRNESWIHELVHRFVEIVQKTRDELAA